MGGIVKSTVWEVMNRQPPPAPGLSGEVLRVAIGGTFVGFIEIMPETTLEQVRVLIARNVSPATQVMHNLGEGGGGGP
jgi:hypothetical protein